MHRIGVSGEISPPLPVTLDDGKGRVGDPSPAKNLGSALAEVRTGRIAGYQVSTGWMKKSIHGVEGWLRRANTAQKVAIPDLFSKALFILSGRHARGAHRSRSRPRMQQPTARATDSLRVALVVFHLQSCLNSVAPSRLDRNAR